MHTASILSLVLLAVASVRCAPQQSGSLTELITSVFGNQSTPPPITPDPNTGKIPGIPEATGCAAGSECVPHFLCRDSSIVKDGGGLIDIRFDGDPKPCVNYLEECCSVDDTSTTPLVHPPATPEGCGFRNVDGVGFKITGDKDNETQYGEFPWMVAVLKEDKAENQILNIYQCGGSLILPTVVLTAAHCVFGKPANTLKVRAGEWDTQTKTELFQHQDRDVVEVITHEHYNKGSLHNDIALLYVDTPFELAENVKTVCLPPPKTNFDHARCFATGWGKDVFGQVGKYQVILKKIDLPMIPRAECQKSLRTTRLGKHFELHRSFICAGGEIGKDTCRGDGGSPLVCPIVGKPEQYYQSGIVAWGIGCGDAIPGVYVGVSELREWLDEQLAYKKVDSKYYTP